MGGGERLSAGDVAEPIVEALAGGRPAVSAVILAADGAALVGDRLLVRADETLGTTGDAALDHAVAERARELLGGGAAGSSELRVAGHPYLVYFEPHLPPPPLVIAGAGHIARPLCRIAALLGFSVTVLDDRAEFATRERFPEAERVLHADWSQPFREVAITPATHLVLVTRGHKYDYEALRGVLRSAEQPAYIGMIGSRRRVRAALEQLAAEGIPAASLSRIHAPVGLDLGAETPEEIAVAIAAELVLVRRGGTGAPLRDVERVVERWIQRE